MIDFQLTIPAVFLQLRPAQFIDFPHSADDDNYENESWYCDALQSKIAANQAVTDQLLWDLAIELDQKKTNAALTADGYIRVALFVPQLYFFIAEKTTLDPEKYQANAAVTHISDGILQSLINRVEGRILPNFNGTRVRISLLDHYFSEYLFKINQEHYQQQLMLSPEKKSEVVQLLLALSAYASRDAFRFLHEIYAHDINTAEQMPQLKAALEKLKAHYTTYQFEQIFDVGAIYHLVAMYSQVLSRLSHLAVAEIQKLYQDNPATNPYENSSLSDFYLSLEAMERDAIELASTLDKLLTQKEKSIYLREEIDLMKQDYQNKFKPTILQPDSCPTQIFQKHLNHYETQRLKAKAMQCSM